MDITTADNPPRSEPAKQKIKGIMKNISIHMPSGRQSAKYAGIALVACATLYGCVSAANAATAYGKRRLDSFALSRVESNPGLSSQLASVTVKVPVIDPGATADFESSIRNAAQQGASDGASGAVKDSLK
jgi:hypothetical protein